MDGYTRSYQDYQDYRVRTDCNNKEWPCLTIQDCDNCIIDGGQCLTDEGKLWPLTELVSRADILGVRSCACVVRERKGKMSTVCYR